MAIARGAGTEIIRSAHFEAITNTGRSLIVGVQHHIYTVLSIIVNARALNASGDFIELYFSAYDSHEGTTAQSHYIFHEGFSAVNQTFVWNDKFSFNGYEPVNFTGPMDDATKQDAIADQGSGVAQILKAYGSASCEFDLHLTFIDQNNS